MLDSIAVNTRRTLTHRGGAARQGDLVDYLIPGDGRMVNTEAPTVFLFEEQIVEMKSSQLTQPLVKSMQLRKKPQLQLQLTALIIVPHLPASRPILSATVLG